MNQWEIWLANFPYDDNPNIVKKRPVIILNVDPLEVLSVKVTSHNIRDNDDFDTTIIYWKYAGLERPSVARVSKSIIVTKDKFSHKIGELHKNDRKIVMNKFVKFIHQK